MNIRTLLINLDHKSKMNRMKCAECTRIDRVSLALIN